ncbi:hypothetical protein LOK49_LG13G02952 [Camellia lanceoleosa]|uniref:Uncharacterized protein n=1 Tax=Camellia lanceoleosa TaxID=1840588 RepID=A0ACC0FH84_9ERIC|nr:hypothetical protein LOK49_LG13G02952 [Camellia lanceoleosa]
MAMTLLWLLLVVAAPLCSASANVQIKVTNNPADELVATLNGNRTANKGSTLFDNPGLACIALQYIKAYQGQCDEVGGPDAKKPADSEFADTFAPNCGVSASTLSPITGRLLGCQSKYQWQAQQQLCFGGGVAKVSRPGCFSGANDDCSGADDWSQTPHVWTIVVGALIAVSYAFGL